MLVIVVVIVSRGRSRVGRGGSLRARLNVARGPTALRAIVVLPVLLLAFDHSEIRPHLLAWIYVATLGLLLERRRFGWVLALLLLWANTHASVLLGVGLAGLACLEEAWKSRGRTLLLWATAVALVNPYGWDIYTLFFRVNQSAGFVGEWQPYGSDTWQFFPLVALVVAVAVALRWSSVREFPPGLAHRQARTT